MTKIPRVAEVVEVIRQRHIHLKANNPVGFVHLFADIKKALTADRLALLTELREWSDKNKWDITRDVTVIRLSDLQAHLDELINSTK